MAFKMAINKNIDSCTNVCGVNDSMCDSQLFLLGWKQSNGSIQR